MSRTGHLPSRTRVMTGLRRSVAVLIAGRPHAHPHEFEWGRPACCRGRLTVPGRRRGSPAPSAPPSDRGAPASPAPASLAPTPTPTPATATVGTPNVGRRRPHPLPIARLQARLTVDPRQVQGARRVGHDRLAGRAFVDRGQWLRRHRPSVKVVSGTAFSIGSVSKTFLATLILELVQEHKVSLTTRSCAGCPRPGCRPRSRSASCSNHTSGLYDFFENPKIDPALLRPAAPGLVHGRVALSYMGKP